MGTGTCAGTCSSDATISLSIYCGFMACASLYFVRPTCVGLMDRRFASFASLGRWGERHWGQAPRGHPCSSGAPPPEQDPWGQASRTPGTAIGDRHLAGTSVAPALCRRSDACELKGKEKPGCLSGDRHPERTPGTAIGAIGDRHLAAGTWRPVWAALGIGACGAGVGRRGVARCLSPFGAREPETLARRSSNSCRVTFLPPFLAARNGAAWTRRAELGGRALLSGECLSPFRCFPFRCPGSRSGIGTSALLGPLGQVPITVRRQCRPGYGLSGYCLSPVFPGL